MPRNDDDALLLDYLHGQLAAEQEAALDQRLRADRALGRRLQQLAAEESVIAEWARARRWSAERSDPSPSAHAAGDHAAGDRPIVPRRWRRSTWVLWGAGLAASLVLVALVGWPRSPQYLATVVQAENAQSANAPLAVGRRLLAGERVRLDAGWVEIAYRSGPRVMLQAPADFEMSASGGRLEQGSLAAEAAPGFLITTPAGSVHDLGTRFAVSVGDQGQASVEVFAGQVLAKSAAAQGAEGTLGPGQAAQFDAAQPQLRPLAAGQPQFAEVRRLLNQTTVEAVADHFVRGGEAADEVQSEGQNEWMLLKRDPWKRLGVCRKAWVRFVLPRGPLAAGPATFTFRHANSNAPGSTAPHFVGKVLLYGLRNDFSPEGGMLGVDWSEQALTWNNAPANDVHHASGLTAAADLLGSIDVNAGPGGSPAGTTFRITFPDLQRYRQADGTVTLVLTVAEQTGFDPNLYVVAHESTDFAGPLLTCTLQDQE